MTNPRLDERAQEYATQKIKLPEIQKSEDYNLIDDLIYDAFIDGFLAAQAEAEKLAKALEFYADYMNYSVDYDTSQNGFSRRCVLYKDIEERNEATGLAGQRARAALAEYRKDEK
jgi:hypothetical protein